MYFVNKIHSKIGVHLKFTAHPVHGENKTNLICNALQKLLPATRNILYLDGVDNTPLQSLLKNNIVCINMFLLVARSDGCFIDL